MKDLNLTRSINVALAGVLVSVTGCGGNGGTASKVCQAYEECDKADFEDTYSSMQDCVDTINEYIEEYEDAEGPECGNAYTDLLNCGAKVYQDTCDYDDIFDDCAEEVEDFVDLCL